MIAHDKMPRLGFGTYGRTGDAGIGAMLFALEVGYRHFDTAQSYGTERELGLAVARSGVGRENVFLTTKIDTANFERGKLVPSLERSLEAMGVEQADLTLIHWPSPNEAVPLAVYLEQLADAHALRLTRSIGVSNFTIAHLEAARGILAPLPITTNQIELNPHLQNRALANYCVNNGILVTCYLPIAHGTLAGDPVLEQIARQHGATVEQVALAFELAQGYAAIPTSGRKDRIRSNFEAQRLRLGPDDIRAIAGADRGSRRIDPVWGPRWDPA